jgi:hypothetical protein
MRWLEPGLPVRLDLIFYKPFSPVLKGIFIVSLFCYLTSLLRYNLYTTKLTF